MKLKHVKKTREALRSFMHEAAKLPSDLVLDMGRPNNCIYRAITGEMWGSVKIEKLFNLCNKSDQCRLNADLNDAIVNLFDGTEHFLPNPSQTTVQDWMVHAKMVFAQFDVVIAEMTLDKYVSKERKKRGYDV